MRKYLKLISSLLFFAFIFTGCLEVDDPNKEQRDESNRILEDYIQKNNIQAEKSEHGYYYEVLNESSVGAETDPGDILGVYYNISLLNGKVIDSLQPSMGEPMPYRHLVNKIYPVGLDYAASKMSAGDKYRLYLPSYLSYGDIEIDSLMPSYANVIAELEIVYVNDSTQQVQRNIQSLNAYAADEGWGNLDSYESGLLYHQIEAGTGEQPDEGEQVKVKYTGKLLNGEIFDQSADDTPFTFRVGMGQVIKGWDEGIAKMKKGEKGVLLLPSNLAYWETNSNRNYPYELFLPTEVLNNFIPPFSPLVFEVELLNE